MSCRAVGVPTVTDDARDDGGWRARGGGNVCARVGGARAGGGARDARDGGGATTTRVEGKMMSDD